MIPDSIEYDQIRADLIAHGVLKGPLDWDRLIKNVMRQARATKRPPMQVLRDCAAAMKTQQPCEGCGQ